MFTKLLKQEWRATRGILGLLCLVSLIAAVLGGGSMRFLVGTSQETEENGCGSRLPPPFLLIE